MQVIKGEYPPNYEDICAVFDIKDDPNIVFTYGDKLYAPGSPPIDVHLLRHEETHERQQSAMGVEAWWDRYLSDANFRYEQELEAYRNQYRSMATLPLHHRLGYLSHMAKSLAGKMYGEIVNYDEAKDAITKDIILKHFRPSNNDLRKARKQQRDNRKKGRK